jgi:hypothetical protein
MSTERSGRGGQRQGRVPDFFIVGHHKSGTTAMYEMLRPHPAIYMPAMKEPEFFGRERSGRQRDAYGHPLPARTFGATRPQTYAEYLALFEAAGPEQLAGEASPSYLGSETAAKLIADVQPAARIIAILREPASFLNSLHLQLVRNHVQSEWDLRKAIANEGIRGEGEWVHRYTDRVRYVEQLQRYHEVFPAEQVLVLIYDDFRADNEGTVRAVLRFLGVDDTLPVKSREANPTIAPRSRALDTWVQALRGGRGPISRGVRSTFKSLTPPQARRRAIRRFQRNVVYASPSSPDASLMAELRERFKPEVVALSDYLHRDLVTLWGYDSIG